MAGLSTRAAGLAALALLAFAAAANGASRAGAGERASPGPAAASAAVVDGYVSLARDRVNARRGPGLEHRVDWVYTRRGLPLKLLGESGPWRRVRDPDGAETWILSDYLAPALTVYVRGDALGSTALRRRADGTAPVAAYLGRGLVARLEACAGDYRLLKVSGAQGWAHKDELWGADACAHS
ncbi:MAG: SH3 domain-containing protein [Hyphomonadaceae bacterium]|nr:SH3 domain-containing protein [Hyphomonadaceae bacterium]